MWPRFNKNCSFFFAKCLKKLPLTRPKTFFTTTNGILLCSGVGITGSALGNNAKASQSKEKSNNNLSDLNKRFDDKDVSSFVESFGDGTFREVVPLKDIIVNEIASLLSLKGKTVADLGSGTGMFVPSFLEKVGENGKVICLDISSNFINYLTKRKEKENWNNVIVNMTNNKSLCLPDNLKGTIDVVFICDAYHHFDYPKLMLAEIHRYLRPGGHLIVVDYNRHDHGHSPGQGNGHGHGHGHGHSHNHNHNHNHNHAANNTKKDVKKMTPEEFKQSIPQHVPFTSKQCKDEIESQGFNFEKSILEEHLKDHFIYIFRK